MNHAARFLLVGLFLTVGFLAAPATADASCCANFSGAFCWDCPDGFCGATGDEWGWCSCRQGTSFFGCRVYGFCSYRCTIADGGLNGCPLGPTQATPLQRRLWATTIQRLPASNRQSQPVRRS